MDLRALQEKRKKLEQHEEEVDADIEKKSKKCIK